MGRTGEHMEAMEPGIGATHRTPEKHETTGQKMGTFFLEILLTELDIIEKNAPFFLGGFWNSLFFGWVGRQWI